MPATDPAATTQRRPDKTKQPPPSWMLPLLRAAGLPPDVNLAALEPEQEIDLFIQLEGEAKLLDELQKRIGAAIRDMQPRLIDYFQKVGRQSEKRHGVTVYLARDIWPEIDYDGLAERHGLNPNNPTHEHALAELRGSGRDELIQVLRDNEETEFLVKPNYNAQTLRSWVLNDLPRDELGTPIMPEPLRGILTTADRFKIKVRRS